MYTCCPAGVRRTRAPSRAGLDQLLLFQQERPSSLLFEQSSSTFSSLEAEPRDRVVPWTGLNFLDNNFVNILIGPPVRPGQHYLPLLYHTRGPEEGGTAYYLQVLMMGKSRFHEFHSSGSDIVDNIWSRWVTYIHVSGGDKLMKNIFQRNRDENIFVSALVVRTTISAGYPVDPDR